MTTLRQLACGLTFLAAGCRGALAEDRHQIARVSVDSFGRQADSLSFASKISAEGRYVALWSRASNLVPHDTNNADDIFVHDCKTGQTERVSVSTSGAQADGASALPSISADGRFVVFASGATNLVPGNVKDTGNIYVYDRRSGRIRTVRLPPSEAQANHHYMEPSVSADGRFVLFTYGDRLSASGNRRRRRSGRFDIFLYGLETGLMEKMRFSSSGEVTTWALSVKLSVDARFMAYMSNATFLSLGEEKGRSDVLVCDRETGGTDKVTKGLLGNPADNVSDLGSLSADGRFIAFYSHATNLVPGDTNGKCDVFVYDRRTRGTDRLSLSLSGGEADNRSWLPSISADGRFVAFVSDATNLVAGDTNGKADVFVHDRRARLTERVSVDSSGAQANGGSWVNTISADGRFVLFISEATNLVDGDTNGVRDVFVAQNPLAR